MRYTCKKPSVNVLLLVAIAEGQGILTVICKYLKMILIL